ncbi:MAG: indole-3-glycerol phosphate synthase TrpC [Spirochaetota bacterium]
MDILEQIVADKWEDLAGLKQGYPLRGKGPRKRRKISPEAIRELLLERRIIAEVKRSSPSMGQIDMGVDYVQQARDYESGGAAMISVLTDERHFSGSFTFLEEIGRAVDCPLLCKDFIVDEWQLDAAEFAGADAVLLIVGCFSDTERLRYLYDYALAKGLLPLVELYLPEERYSAYQLKPYLLGVNSRNLKTMEIDLAQGAQTLALVCRELEMPQSREVRSLAGVPDLPLFVGESGIFEASDAHVWAAGGADCLLVGTSLMLAGKESGDVSERIRSFQSVFSTGEWGMGL